MNIFNVVLDTIRRKCTRVNAPYADCWEYLKSEIEQPYHENLDFYLDFLQDLGLIKYDMRNKTISLTERGRYTEKLFS